MRIFAGIAFVLVIAACGKGSGGTSSSAWISGPAPALFGPLATLDPSMTEAQARAKDPALMSKGHVPDPDHDGVVYYARTHADGRVWLRVAMPKRDARATIEAAWGKPLDGVIDDKPAAIWLDPTKHLRAILTDETTDKAVLDFDAYVPATTLIAGDAQHPALGGVPALGSVGTQTEDQLPPIESADAPTHLFLERDAHGALVTEWIRVQPELRAQGSEELLAVMKQRWGEPHAGTFRGSAALVFGTGQVHAIADGGHDGRWSIFVTSEPVS